MTNNKERSLIFIKPDCFRRGLVGEITSRYERTGLKLVGLKMVKASDELIEKHYLADPDWFQKSGTKTIESYRHKGKTPPSEDPIQVAQIVLGSLKRYLTQSPLVVMVWQGINAIGVVKKITGSTEPLTSDVGTVRGDLTIDSYEVADIEGRAVENLVHASGSSEEAEKEIAVWFKEEELIE